MISPLPAPRTHNAYLAYNIMNIFRIADTLNPNAEGGEISPVVFRHVHEVLDHTVPLVERALAGCGMGDIVTEINNEEAYAAQPAAHNNQAAASAVANSVEFVPPPADISVAEGGAATPITQQPQYSDPEMTAAAAAVNNAYGTDVDDRLAAMGYTMTQGELK